jgi:glucose-1-phosphate adenylyltransferase
MNKIIALLNCHNSPELGELTSNRPLASTSFLGRYAFMDFAMSNFTNSGIQNVNVLVKNHQRSLLKHMGNMMSWVNNTKTGRDTIFYNEKGILNPAYNTDINNIKENDWVLYESNANLLVFEAPEIVASIDLRPFIEEHQKRMEEITIVYKEIDDANKEFIGADVLDID